MNGYIVYPGIEDPIACADVVLDTFGRSWSRLSIASATVPHMLHLLCIQGLPTSLLFSGTLSVDADGWEVVDLSEWLVAKCRKSKIHEVPYRVMDVVLVKGSNPSDTTQACMAAINNK